MCILLVQEMCDRINKVSVSPSFVRQNLIAVAAKVRLATTVVCLTAAKFVIFHVLGFGLFNYANICILTIRDNYLL